MPRPGAIRNTKLTRAEWRGVRELERDLKNILSHVSGERQAAGIRSVDEVIADGANFLYYGIKQRAAAGGWPQRVQRAIFSYTKQGVQREGKKRTALVGVRTGAPTMRGRGEVKSKQNPGGIYFEWHGAGQGRTIGMSAAAMWERGAGHVEARPAVRPTIQQDGPVALQKLQNGYRGIIRQFND